MKCSFLDSLVYHHSSMLFSCRRAENSVCPKVLSIPAYESSTDSYSTLTDEPALRMSPGVS